MAWLCERLVFSLTRRSFVYPHVRYFAKVTMGDPLEHATGIDKRELLARAAGCDNPFDYKLIKRGPGTRDQPTEIPSAFEERIIGCICLEESVAVNYMLLHKGQPKRCECGYWFTLVHKAPV